MKSACLVILLLLLGSSVVAADPQSVIKDSIIVRIVGTLRTGVMAVGGETTGTTVTAHQITWELEFGKDAALRQAAEKLQGKKVTVQGSLERLPGVETKERWIVAVSALQPVADASFDVDPATRLHAKVGRVDTRIRFESEADSTIFDINSNFGIDRATITRESEDWPKSILVRLHLNGLESFRVGSGETAVEWSVASTGQNAVRMALHKAGDESTLDETSPYYSNVRIVGGGRKIPLKGGFFEVPLPAKLFEENPKEITLRWIDFYRN